MCVCVCVPPPPPHSQCRPNPHCRLYLKFLHLHPHHPIHNVVLSLTVVFNQNAATTLPPPLIPTQMSSKWPLLFCFHEKSSADNMPITVIFPYVTMQDDVRGLLSELQASGRVHTGQHVHLLPPQDVARGVSSRILAQAREGWRLLQPPHLPQEPAGS